MENEIEAMLDKLQAWRKEQFGKSEEIYKLLGGAMGKLMDIRLILREKIRNGA